jgi:hypothetical protein
MVTCRFHSMSIYTYAMHTQKHVANRSPKLSETSTQDRSTIELSEIRAARHNAAFVAGEVGCPHVHTTPVNNFIR